MKIYKMEKEKQIFCADKNICPVIAKQNAQNKWELWHLSNCHEREEEAKYEHRLFEGHAYDAVEAKDSTTGRTLIKVLEDGIWREIVLIQPPIVVDDDTDIVWQHSNDTITPMWIKYFRAFKKSESLEDLLERGAGIKTILIDLTDALVEAFGVNVEKMTSITDYFFKNGIDVNEKDEWGNTAFINACRAGYETIVKLLLDNGANVNDKTNHGETALMYASQYKWDTDVAKWLLEKGANVNEKDKWGGTALTYAFDVSNFASIRLLLNHGSDINGLKYTFTGSYWDGCRMWEVIKIIEHCLMKNIDINSKDEEGMTLFMRLAGTKTVRIYFEGTNRGFSFFRESPIEALNLLLKNGADINAKSKEGKTALHYANDYTDFEYKGIIQKHTHQLTKWLVKKGADVHATDNYGKTALMYAKEAGLKNVAKYLYRKMKN